MKGVQQDIISLLLESGAKINLRHHFEDSALDLATKNGNLRVVQQLLKAKGPKDYKMEKKVLVIAAKFGHLDLVNEMIKNKVNLNYIDESKSTALVEAARREHTNIITILIESGTGFQLNLDFQDSLGQTALMAAMLSNNIEIIGQLIEVGANIHIKDNYGKTIYDYDIKHIARNVIDISLSKLTLNNLRKDNETYFSIIPKDLIGLIKNYINIKPQSKTRTRKTKRQ